MIAVAGMRSILLATRGFSVGTPPPVAVGTPTFYISALHRLTKK